MIWRIVESSTGFHTQRCVVTLEKVPLTNRTIEQFTVYESARFDTRRQAEKYIEHKTT